MAFCHLHLLGRLSGVVSRSSCVAICGVLRDGCSLLIIGHVGGPEFRGRRFASAYVYDTSLSRRHHCGGWAVVNNIRYCFHVRMEPYIGVTIGPGLPPDGASDSSLLASSERSLRPQVPLANFWDHASRALVIVGKPTYVSSPKPSVYFSTSSL